MAGIPAYYIIDFTPNGSRAQHIFWEGMFRGEIIRAGDSLGEIRPPMITQLK
jgi:hypothetical protein